jgi:hypothetical protein
MGRYFGREPRYSREELERQAKEAIDARVSMGRPPEEEWQPIKDRLAEVDQALAARPPVPPLPEAEPLQIREIRMPQARRAAPKERAAAPARRAKQSVGARSRGD